MGTIVLETCLAYENSFWEQEHGNILSFKEGIGRRQQKEENFVAKVSSWSKKALSSSASQELHAEDPLMKKDLQYPLQK